ncbi:hypothetical protein HZC09_02710 [Candidatus Micrarchaeota archaeon]|nr:hypothetical protein [Candidatus Micrarchaeota archaeon]
MDYFWQVVELFVYAIVFYFFWDMVINTDGIKRKPEPVVKEFKNKN